jgi:Tol biopolymer transport system component
MLATRPVVRKSFAIILCAVGSVHTLAHADRLVETREVVRGNFLAPQVSPDGRDVLLSGPHFEGLFVAPIAGGAARALTSDAEAGVHARWLGDGRVAFRAKRAGARRELVVGGDRSVKTFVPAVQVAFTKDDLMYVVDRTGKLVRIGSGDRFFGATVSPDGDKVVYQGLATGLHLYVRSTGVTKYIGPGTAPAWSPDSARLAYEVTEDDGHDIVASELFVYDVARDVAAPITQSDRTIERRPSFAPNGTLAFDDNTGGIFVGRLEVQ